ncbi:AMP-binding protein, partial [Bacillus cereus group sp. BC53]
QTIAPELATATPGDLHAARVPSLRTVVSMGDVAPAGMFRFADLMARGRQAVDPALLDALGATLEANEPINIQFTSGTTGSPKGAT